MARIFMLVAALALVAAACGTQTDDDGDHSSETAAAAASTTTNGLPKSSRVKPQPNRNAATSAPSSAIASLRRFLGIETLQKNGSSGRAVALGERERQRRQEIFPGPNFA